MRRTGDSFASASGLGPACLANGHRGSDRSSVRLGLLRVVLLAVSGLLIRLDRRAVRLWQLRFDLLILFLSQLVCASLKDQFSLLSSIGLRVELGNKVTVTFEQASCHGTELCVADQPGKDLLVGQVRDP